MSESADDIFFLNGQMEQYIGFTLGAEVWKKGKLSERENIDISFKVSSHWWSTHLHLMFGREWLEGNAEVVSE